MTNGDGNRVFLDTNVLVFSNVTQAPLHQAARHTLQRLVAENELWISRQVLREYLATLSRQQQFSKPHPPEVLAADIHYFQSHFLIAEDNPSVTERLLELIQQFPTGGKQVHDANIVATMLAHNISALFTHNTGDFARFSSLITIMPLEIQTP